MGSGRLRARALRRPLLKDRPPPKGGGAASRLREYAGWYQTCRWHLAGKLVLNNNGQRGGGLFEWRHPTVLKNCGESEGGCWWWGGEGTRGDFGGVLERGV